MTFFGQLSIVCVLTLDMKHLASFMSHDIPMSKFSGVKIIVPRNELDRYEKKILLLDINRQRKLMTAFKKMLAKVDIVVEDLAFSLIRSIACIYL